jgi:hypothetical protein
MALFAERNQRIGSENAFKVGPHIVHVGQSSGPVVKLNLGEPDYDLPKGSQSRRLNDNLMLGIRIIVTLKVRQTYVVPSVNT